MDVSFTQVSALLIRVWFVGNVMKTLIAVSLMDQASGDVVHSAYDGVSLRWLLPGRCSIS